MSPVREVPAHAIVRSQSKKGGTGLTTIHSLILFVHLAAILLLLALHGGAVAVSYALREERRPERVAALLDLSRLTFDSSRWFGRLFWFDVLAVVVTGIALMLIGGFWRHVWPWASIVVFLAIVAVMSSLGSGGMRELRRAAGLPWVVRQGFGPPTWMPAEAADATALEKALGALRVRDLTIVGAGGFLVLLWLMVYKPL
jgi:hypothetical protein